MSQDPIRGRSAGIDLSDRFVESTTVVASPAAAAETIIAQTQGLTTEAIVAGAQLSGWAAFTIGANATAVRLRIRRTNASGTVVADTGALTAGVAAAALAAIPVQGNDAAPPQNTVYVLTLQVTGGTTASTVSATSLRVVLV